jgi:hypothetical protein
MIKYALFVSAILFTGAAKADIFRCSFSNPFTTVTYSMVQQKLTIWGPSIPKREVNGVTFQVRSAVKFELSKAGTVLVRLELNRTGSDGETAFDYPYEGVWNGNTGGCESNFLRRVSLRDL